MSAALGFEWLQFLRAPIVRVVSLLLGLGLPVLAAVLMAAAAADGSTQLGLKAAAMSTGTSWDGYVGVVGMMLSVAAFLAIGFIACWTFGREFTDGTQACLFALAVGRPGLALAKFAVLLAWSMLASAACLGVALLVGLSMGFGFPEARDLGGLARSWVAGCLTALLACPLAWVASVARGYLTGVGTLVLVVMATQIATAFGVGAWNPYAAPGLWTGLAGPVAASQVGLLQLALCPAVGIAGMAVTCLYWRSMEIRA